MVFYGEASELGAESWRMKFTPGGFKLTPWGYIAKVIVTTLLYNDLPVQLADLEALVRPESYRFVSL